MNAKDLARDVANVAWDVLQTLTSSMKFWRMNGLTSGAVVPGIRHTDLRAQGARHGVLPERRAEPSATLPSVG